MNSLIRNELENILCTYLSRDLRIALQPLSNQWVICKPSAPIHIFGRDIEAVSGRAEVFSNSELIETIHMLYWDETKRKLRRGYSTETRPGNIHRLLADVRNQRKKTQDWYSMTARQIVASLPEEFDYWKNLRR